MCLEKYIVLIRCRCLYFDEFNIGYFIFSYFLFVY